MVYVLSLLFSLILCHESRFFIYCIALMRTKHNNELSIQRDETTRLELRLAEERRERKQVEESLNHLHAEHNSKIRDIEGALNLKILNDRDKLY